MKQCNSCNTTKPATDFHKRAASRDGLAARCRLCQSSYDRARANDPERVETRRIYAQTEAGIEAGRRAKRKWAQENKTQLTEANRAYRQRNPNKARAHGMVGYAIKQGRLIAAPCEVCGVTDEVHAHHDDYNKSFEVRWLCSPHHRQWHAEHGEALNP